MFIGIRSLACQKINYCNQESSKRRIFLKNEHFYFTAIKKAKKGPCIGLFNMLSQMATFAFELYAACNKVQLVNAMCKLKTIGTRIVTSIINNIKSCVSRPQDRLMQIQK